MSVNQQIKKEGQLGWFILTNKGKWDTTQGDKGGFMERRQFFGVPANTPTICIKQKNYKNPMTQILET